jgi:transposase
MPVHPVARGNARCAASGCRCHDRARFYPSDTSDAEWDLLEPQVKAAMAALVKAEGRPMDHDLRAMTDAVFYVVRNGIEWRALPVDFPPWAAV